MRVCVCACVRARACACGPAPCAPKHVHHTTQDVVLQRTNNVAVSDPCHSTLRALCCGRATHVHVCHSELLCEDLVLHLLLSRWCDDRVVSCKCHPVNEPLPLWPVVPHQRVRVGAHLQVLVRFHVVTVAEEPIDIVRAAGNDKEIIAREKSKEVTELER